jgi:hypothetical protein
MFSRKLNSEVCYPFIPEEVPDRKYISGILDVRLFVTGDPAGDSGTVTKPYFAYMASLVQQASSTRYTFFAISKDSGKYWRFTFTVPWDMGQGVVQNNIAEECRGVMTVSASYIYRTDNLILGSISYELEPGTQVWLEKRVKSINFVNEWRNYDPVQRTNLSNNYLGRFIDSDTIKLNSGYNMGLGYTSGTLTVDGYVGNGLGVAPDNMWDVGPTWNTSQDGLLMVNGVLPNTNGDIPIDKSASVTIMAKKGSLEIST